MEPRIAALNVQLQPKNEPIRLDLSCWNDL
jgi:hypothetical protein